MRNISKAFCSILLLHGILGFASQEGDVLDYLPAILSSIKKATDDPIGLRNGWFVDRDGKAIWGYAGHNSWWSSSPTRPNITRLGGGSGPLHTVDLESFAASIKQFGFSGFEHNYGLWYDRRRDVHDTVCRSNGNVIGPTLEQPWARSGSGMACDGRSRYDLTEFNSYYFDRLREFAAIAQDKGVVFINNHYMQHTLLEIDAHYVDFPWRPGNNTQNVSMPNGVPAANSFYDISNPQKRDLHKRYITKMLDELGDYPNVVHLTSQEYTGDLDFMRFWIDTIKEWEASNGKEIHIGLGATKDVQDAILNDESRSEDIDSVNLQYWWYRSDGSLKAPSGGQNYPGRYSLGIESAQTSARRIYSQMREYRELYPRKALLHHIHADLNQTWAFLMGGGSMLIRYLRYGSSNVRDYITAPLDYSIIRHSYAFINSELSDLLPKMKPADISDNESDRVWSMSDNESVALFYIPNGASFNANLSRLSGNLAAVWFNPSNGDEFSAGIYSGGASYSFSTPSNSPWVLLFK